MFSFHLRFIYSDQKNTPIYFMGSPIPSIIKNIVLAFLCFFFLPDSMKAQDNTDDVRKRIIFGLKAGINYSNVYDSQGEEFVANAKVGFAGGAFLAIPLGTYFGLQPEALFSQKGFHSKGMLLGSTYDMTRTTDYLDFPIYFTIKPTRFLTLMAGPQYSYLMRQRNSFANGTTTIEQEKKFDNDNIRKNTLCFSAGLDINVKHIVVGARVGFDLRENNADNSSTTPRYKNVWYQATIGYRFYQ
jgi:hypothetical protein